MALMVLFVQLVLYWPNWPIYRTLFAYVNLDPDIGDAIASKNIFTGKMRKNIKVSIKKELNRHKPSPNSHMQQLDCTYTKFEVMTHPFHKFNIC